MSKSAQRKNIRVADLAALAGVPIGTVNMWASHKYIEVVVMPDRTRWVVASSAYRLLDRMGALTTEEPPEEPSRKLLADKEFAPEEEQEFPDEADVSEPAPTRVRRAPPVSVKSLPQPDPGAVAVKAAPVAPVSPAPSMPPPARHWYYVDGKPEAYPTLKQALQVMGFPVAAASISWKDVPLMVKGRIQRTDVLDGGNGQEHSTGS